MSQRKPKKAAFTSEYVTRSGRRVKKPERWNPSEIPTECVKDKDAEKTDSENVVDNKVHFPAASVDKFDSSRDNPKKQDPSTTDKQAVAFSEPAPDATILQTPDFLKMQHNFLIEESKCDSFDDSLNEPHPTTKKMTISSRAVEQNLVHKKIRERQKLYSNTLYDSLEDICSLMSNVEKISGGEDAQHNSNLPLEKSIIGDDSLMNDIDPKITELELEEQPFEDDSLAIIEYEKAFDDSLEEAELIEILNISHPEEKEAYISVEHLNSGNLVTRNLFETTEVQCASNMTSLCNTKNTYLKVENDNSQSVSDCNISRDSLEKIVLTSETARNETLNDSLLKNINSNNCHSVSDSNISNDSLENSKAAKAISDNEKKNDIELGSVFQTTTEMQYTGNMHSICAAENKINYLKVETDNSQSASDCNISRDSLEKVVLTPETANSKAASVVTDSKKKNDVELRKIICGNSFVPTNYVSNDILENTSMVSENICKDNIKTPLSQIQLEEVDIKGNVSPRYLPNPCTIQNISNNSFNELEILNTCSLTAVPNKNESPICVNPEVEAICNVSVDNMNSSMHDFSKNSSDIMKFTPQSTQIATSSVFGIYNNSPILMNLGSDDEVDCSRAISNNLSSFTVEKNGFQSEENSDNKSTSLLVQELSNKKPFIPMTKFIIERQSPKILEKSLEVSKKTIFINKKCESNSLPVATESESVNVPIPNHDNASKSISLNTKSSIFTKNLESNSDLTSKPFSKCSDDVNNFKKPSLVVTKNITQRGRFKSKISNSNKEEFLPFTNENISVSNKSCGLKEDIIEKPFLSDVKKQCFTESFNIVDVKIKTEPKYDQIEENCSSLASTSEKPSILSTITTVDCDLNSLKQHFDAIVEENNVISIEPTCVSNEINCTSLNETINLDDSVCIKKYSDEKETIPTRHKYETVSSINALPMKFDIECDDIVSKRFGYHPNNILVKDTESKLISTVTSFENVKNLNSTICLDDTLCSTWNSHKFESSFKEKEVISSVKSNEKTVSPKCSAKFENSISDTNNTIYIDDSICGPCESYISVKKETSEICAENLEPVHFNKILNFNDTIYLDDSILLPNKLNINEIENNDENDLESDTEDTYYSCSSELEDKKFSNSLKHNVNYVSSIEFGKGLRDDSVLITDEANCAAAIPSNIKKEIARKALEAAKSKEKNVVTLQIEVAVDTREVNILSVSPSKQDAQNKIVANNTGSNTSTITSNKNKQVSTKVGKQTPKKQLYNLSSPKVTKLNTPKSLKNSSRQSLKCKDFSKIDSFKFQNKLKAETPKLVNALDLHDSSMSFIQDRLVESRDSIIPLNLCIRETPIQRRDFLKSDKKDKENIPLWKIGLNNDSKIQSQCSVKRQSSSSCSSHFKSPKPVNLFPELKKSATKIPVRKMDNSPNVPTTLKLTKSDLESRQCGKLKSPHFNSPIMPDKFCTPRTENKIKGKIADITPLKAHHFCTVRNSISRVPKSATKTCSKKYQNIVSPIAQYIRSYKVLAPLQAVNRDFLGTPNSALPSHLSKVPGNASPQKLQLQKIAKKL